MAVTERSLQPHKRKRVFKLPRQGPILTLRKFWNSAQLGFLAISEASTALWGLKAYLGMRGRLL